MPRANSSSDLPALSVIIPTLNEAGNIATTLQTIIHHCSRPHACEIIVVDGGSSDATLTAAQECAGLAAEKGMALRLLASPPGRARQMNRGAEQARGEGLLFLHADTSLPPGFDENVGHALTSEALILGAFHLQTDVTTPALRWICRCANLRARLLDLPYGDQAFFMQRAAFMRLNMFPPLEIMEDFALVRQVKSQGDHITLLPQAVTTSARRWRKRGYIFTTLCNQLMVLGYYLGLPSHQLARWYRR